MTTKTINLLNLSPKELAAWFQTIGEPKFRAQQLIKWVHQQGVIDFAEMSNFSKDLRAKLAELAEIRLPEVIIDREANDGTRKWLLQLEKGNAIEAVLIPTDDRATLCVSSQVGCALNCSFCATGKEGFNRNLTLGEIIGQVWIAYWTVKKDHPDRLRPITNVVMMGMGEPLLNYQPVVAAMDLMMSDNAYGLSKYRVTLSTSGVVPKMYDLSKDSQCSLAVSLHAPNDKLRETLVPLNKKYPLAQLMQACRDFFVKEPKREVVFEYVMLDKINDQIEQAKELVALLKGMNAKVNLIPFNPFPNTLYKTTPWPQIEKFQRYLIKNGVQTWVRRTRGDDIEAACGQLAGEFKDKTGRHERWLKTGKIVTK